MHGLESHSATTTAKEVYVLAWSTKWCHYERPQKKIHGRAKPTPFLLLPPWFYVQK